MPVRPRRPNPTMTDPVGPVRARTALVTGAGNGLGRAIAVALCGAGARVVLTGRRVDALQDTAALLSGPARVATVDVAEQGSVQALARETRR